MGREFFMFSSAHRFNLPIYRNSYSQMTVIFTKYFRLNLLKCSIELLDIKP